MCCGQRLLLLGGRYCGVGVHLGAAQASLGHGGADLHVRLGRAREAVVKKICHCSQRERGIPHRKTLNMHPSILPHFLLSLPSSPCQQAAMTDQQKQATGKIVQVPGAEAQLGGALGGDVLDGGQRHVRVRAGQPCRFRLLRPTLQVPRLQGVRPAAPTPHGAPPMNPFRVDVRMDGRMGVWGGGEGSELLFHPWRFRREMQAPGLHIPE
ncbi:hypothetical protein ANANG_G00113910 [Anguilla anguilla]|uniref:Uncharacterized protein n=1 Tax=Anguilla anguilla TaxID=7936 RepID=A0A9D3RYR2_ANGAN|nr:hypothetical protein ANANG_G00113910 [Anguilla anguilla]